jgi:MFS family permease
LSRMMGLSILGAAGSFAVVLLLAGGGFIYVQATVHFFSWWAFAGLMIICLVGLGIASAWVIRAGWRQYQRGRRPVTEEEIMQAKKAHRQAVLTEMRGALPEAYQKRTLVRSIVDGVLLIVFGVPFIIAAFYAGDLPWALAAALLGGGLALVGIAFVALCLYVWLVKVPRHQQIRQREYALLLQVSEVTDVSDK